MAIDIKGLIGTLAKLADGTRLIHEALTPAVSGERAAVGASPAGSSNNPADAPIDAHDIPVRDINDRVAIVAQEIRDGRTHPMIVQMARAVIAKRCVVDGRQGWCIPPHDQKAEIEALFYEVRDGKVRYCSDPVGTDTYAHPRVSLLTRGGDCAALSAALGAFLGAIGREVELVIIREVGEDSWSHIYIRTVYVGKDGLQHVMTLDPATQNPPGWECPDERVFRDSTRFWRRVYRI